MVWSWYQYIGTALTSKQLLSPKIALSKLLWLIICSVYSIDSNCGPVMLGVQTVSENWETVKKTQKVRLEMKAWWSCPLKVRKQVTLDQGSNLAWLLKHADGSTYCENDHFPKYIYCGFISCSFIKSFARM